MSSSAQKHPTRALLTKMAFGAIAGAASMGLFMGLIGDRVFEAADRGVAIASVAGVIYLVIGLFVGLGLSLPGLGARILNVEDVEELHEEAAKLRPAVVVLVFTGAFLLILALSGAGVFPLSEAAGAVLATICLAGISVGAWVGSKRYDEFSIRLGLEASAATLHVAMLVFGAWAALAHFNYVAWITPIGFVSALAAIQLLVSFVVVGRRGMLKPR